VVPRPEYGTPSTRADRADPGDDARLNDIRTQPSRARCVAR
jgi:hypothetical protein